jgi:FkbM family methyltransferase
VPRLILLKLIVAARRALAHTPLARSRWVSLARARLFDLVAPDLSEPVAFRGASLYLHPGDRGYVPSVVGGYYERFELDIFQALAREARVVFDVGANVGIYTVLGCLAAPGLTVHAFEPVAENVELLERNLARHGIGERVTVVQAAVSDHAGQAIIHLGQSGNHSLSNDQGGGERWIETITLDDYVRAGSLHPELIKIDVEGVEGAVLAGAEYVLSLRPTVFMEYTPAAHASTDELLVRLRSTFDFCLGVEEATGRVAELKLSDLGRTHALNLVLTSRPEHAAMLRRFAVA